MFCLLDSVDCLNDVVINAFAIDVVFRLQVRDLILVADVVLNAWILGQIAFGRKLLGTLGVNRSQGIYKHILVGRKLELLLPSSFSRLLL